MTDGKAIRAADLLRQYCTERGCRECVFLIGRDICAITSARIPGYICLDMARKRIAEQGGDENEHI